MIKLVNTIENKSSTKTKDYILTAGISASILLLAALSESSSGAGSTDVIKAVMKSITDLIKGEGKVGLQILSAAAGGLAAAKTVSWQPLLVGAGGAGIIEVLFTAI